MFDCIITDFETIFSRNKKFPSIESASRFGRDNVRAYVKRGRIAAFCVKDEKGNHVVAKQSLTEGKYIPIQVDYFNV